MVHLLLGISMFGSWPDECWTGDKKTLNPDFHCTSPKYGESESMFFHFPPVMQSSGHLPSIIFPLKKSTSVLVHPLKEHQDRIIM